MRMPPGFRVPRAARAALAAGALLAMSGAAPGATPAPGSFLVATREQQGFFAETVVLLIEHDADGSVGLVVNHPTRLPLAKLLPDVGGAENGARPVFLGGPVSLKDVTLLIRADKAPPRAVHVVDDVYATRSLKTLREITEGKLKGARFRAYAGYAGWAPGQLESEIARGAWNVVPAQADAVFTHHPGKLWHRLVRRGNTTIVRLVRPAPGAPAITPGRVRVRF